VLNSNAKSSRSGSSACTSAPHLAGLKAAPNAAPHQIIVTGNERANKPTDAIGFGWVKVSPGNRGFGAWLVRNGLANGAHDYGVNVYPPSLGTTALAPKDAYCIAFARVLREAGVECFADSRLD
jgi:hypothetical protein